MSRGNSDERYVLDLVAEILKTTCNYQHTFEWLRGDPNGRSCKGKKLPLDGYFAEHNLVVEYRERQHTEEVIFFDRKMTVSGVPRGKQRILYDQRREELIPQHGLKLLIIHYFELDHQNNKRLRKNARHDTEVIRKKLAEAGVMNY
jgi:hypothetical protein